MPIELLTDDMRELLKAAHRAAPNGETFILEELPLYRLDALARKDCAFALTREPLRYLEQRQESGPRDAYGQPATVPNPRGTPLGLSKLGRPIAQQLIANDRAERRRRLWLAAAWVWGTLVTIAVGVLIERVNALFEDRREKPTLSQPDSSQRPIALPGTQPAPPTPD